jgi:hypothetical protein
MYGGAITIGNNSPYMLFQHTGTTESLVIGVSSGTGRFNVNTVSGDAVMRYMAGKLHIVRNVSSIPVMTFTGGSAVGINNIAPDSALEIGDNVTAGTGLFLHIDGATADLYLGQSADTLFGFSAGTVAVNTQTAGFPYLFGTTTAQPVIFGTNNIERMRIDSSGNVGIGATPSSAYKWYVAQTATNTTLDGIRVLVGKTASTNGTYYDYAINALLSISISSGVTDSGAAYSFKTDALRNVAGDAGTLTNLAGSLISYGHGSSPDAAATTTNAYGLNITRYGAKGTITNAYDIYLGSPVTGGTVTNSWAIYSANTAPSYFAGNVGIGTLSFGTSAARTLAFGSGTAPSSVITDGIQLWSEDINAAAGKAGLHMMSESGTNKLVVVGTIIKTDTGDPSQVHEGLMVINTYDNNVKVYADGGWRQITSW